MVASSRRIDGRPQNQREVQMAQDEVELSANWGNIVLLLLAMPWLALFTLNPISLFFVGGGLFWVCLLSFTPKFVYYLLLELAIISGRGSAFYEAHHTRRIRGTTPPFSASLSFVEGVFAEYASYFGGVEGESRKIVAIARRKYSDQALAFDQVMRSPPCAVGHWLNAAADGGSEQILERLVGLPWFFILKSKDHVYAFGSSVSHAILRFVALNVVARLYSKTTAKSR